mgnify:CR=1 FL=1
MNYSRHRKHQKQFGRFGTIRIEKHNYEINAIMQADGSPIEFNNINIKLTKAGKKHKIIIEGKRNKAINYMDNFLRLDIINKNRIGISLLSKKLMLYGKNKPCKEICESLAAYFNIKKLIKNIRFNQNVTCIVVADGIRPKTGVIFATRTHWNVHSVDPLMRPEWINGDYDKFFPRLKCHDKKIEEVIDSICSVDNTTAIVIICVHAHVNINNLWNNLITKHECLPILLLSMPCCTGYEQVNIVPIINLIDPAIDNEDCGQIFVWEKNWAKICNLSEIIIPSETIQVNESTKMIEEQNI